MSSYYIKRIAVLKQLSAGYSVSGKSLSGIIKVEKNGAQASVKASLINIAPLNEGNYAAAVTGNDGKIVYADLGQNPTNGDFPLNAIPEIEDGMAALIVFIREGRASAVAYGSSGNCRIGADILKKYFLDKTYETPTKTQIPINTSLDKPSHSYDDEVVASENYFLNEPASNLVAGVNNNNFIVSEEILDYETTKSYDFYSKDERDERDFFEKEKEIKHPFYVDENENAISVGKDFQGGINEEPASFDNTFQSGEIKESISFDNSFQSGEIKESISFDNSFQSGEKEERLFDESFFVNLNNTSNKTAPHVSDEAFQDANFDSSSPPLDKQEQDAPFTFEQKDYYQKVKDELLSLLNTYPKEIELIRSVPDSDWVKIDYSDGKYYAVGIIYSGDRPAYICYGVPAKSSVTPPAQLQGYCSYLPTGSNEDGYWMMYQDARTGECAEVNYI